MREALFEFEMLKDGYWVDLKGFETCVLQGLSEESSREILESHRELALEHFCFVRIENTSNFRFKINLSEWCGDKMRAIQMGKIENCIPFGTSKQPTRLSQSLPSRPSSAST